MNNQKFIELLTEKLSNEISEEDNRQFLLMISDNEEYWLEYQHFEQYFRQKASTYYTNMEILFENIRQRINAVSRSYSTKKPPE